MVFKIFFELPNGQVTSMLIGGPTREHINARVDDEMRWRGATYLWAESA